MPRKVIRIICVYQDGQTQHIAQCRFQGQESRDSSEQYSHLCTDISLYRDMTLTKKGGQPCRRTRLSTVLSVHRMTLETRVSGPNAYGDIQGESISIETVN